MNDAVRAAASRVFQYPVLPLQRRHGPRGYLNHRFYKPWLRDEFCFRCVYCLCRERWEPNGRAVFSVEHIDPRAKHRERAGAYDNLLYSCSVCNACRRDEPLPFDPAAMPLGAHVQVLKNGTVEPLTLEGGIMCDLCHLNRPLLVEFRRYVGELIERLLEQPELGAERALQRLLGFPGDLPNLQSRRPPGGNARPEGIAASWFERRKRAELPEVY